MKIVTLAVILCTSSWALAAVDSDGVMLKSALQMNTAEHKEKLNAKVILKDGKQDWTEVWSKPGLLVEARTEDATRDTVTVVFRVHDEVKKLSEMRIVTMWGQPAEIRQDISNGEFISLKVVPSRVRYAK